MPSNSQASGLTSAEKRLRTLKKKLQQIENLKEKRDRGDELEKTQVCGIVCCKSIIMKSKWLKKYCNNNHDIYPGSSTHRSVFQGGPASRSNWYFFEMLIFEEMGKPEYPEKNLS